MKSQMNKSDVEQLSFFIEEKEDDEQKITPPYGASICSRCLCDKCSNSCEANMWKMTEDEWKQQDTCFNCDECYFYGMDDPSLSQNVVKFECKNFKMIKYYVDLYARKQREKLKIVR